jgi:uncharacterized membrane protein YgcG
LTRYDVPDDDMPENQLPPTWGPAYDERDLDSLLSGDIGSLPDALLPLAGTLATLHAPPVRAELAGEADARAMFRSFAQEAGSWTPGAEHGTVPSHTLVLDRPQADRGQRHTPRHRRRPAGGGLRRPLTIVAGAAAAVVVVAGIALAGLLPGPIRHIGHSSGTTAAATGTSGSSPAPRVEGSASTDPTVRPTPTSSANSKPKPTPRAMCQQYYTFFSHPESKSAWAAEVALGNELDKLAGGFRKVPGFCLPYMDFGSWLSKGMQVSHPHGNEPWPGGNQGASGSGSGSSAGNGSTGGGSTAGGGSNGSAGSGSGSGQQSHGNPAATTAPRPGVSDSQRQAPGSF